jgi:hypothetical protein
MIQCLTCLNEFDACTCKPRTYPGKIWLTDKKPLTQEERVKLYEYQQKGGEVMEENRAFDGIDGQINKVRAQIAAEPKERTYIGCKIIRAIPMDEATFYLNHAAARGGDLEIGPDGKGRPGYKVTYPDGYVSWSPKETFETAYREVTDAERSLL